MLKETVAVGLILGVGAAASAQTAQLTPVVMQEQQEEKQQEQDSSRLVVGDKAPPLMIAEWIKGDPVKQFESGKVYVVEFWATWCGPCIAGMPHLSELQKEYKEKGVRFIGVNIWDEPANVQPFMKDRGKSRSGEPLPSGDELMQYTVAIEKKAEEGERAGKMAKAWMEAAGQRGIPTAFVVNKEGRIAWIGHPSSLDEPLKQIVAGTWDLAAESKRFKKQADLEVRAQPLLQRMQEARMAGDTEGQLAAIDDLLELDDEQFAYLKYSKLMIMLTQQQDYEKGYDYARQLVTGDFSDNPQMLNGIAWTILTEEAIEQRNLELALNAAKRANELTDSEDPAILDTLAKAHFDSGNVEAALRYQEMAVEKAEGFPNMLPELEERLEEYRAAKSKG